MSTLEHWTVGPKYHQSGGGHGLNISFNQPGPGELNTFVTNFYISEPVVYLV